MMVSILVSLRQNERRLFSLIVSSVVNIWLNEMTIPYRKEKK